MSSGLIVHRVDHIVKPVILITIEIGCPATMAREVNEEGVVRLSIFDQPVHGAEDIILGRNTHRIPLVVSKNDHIFAPIPKALMQEGGHISDIVDTSIQLIGLAKIVDANEQSFPASSTS
jgi:hypothetical protein